MIKLPHRIAVPLLFCLEFLRRERKEVWTDLNRVYTEDMLDRWIQADEKFRPHLYIDPLTRRYVPIADGLQEALETLPSQLENRPKTQELIEAIAAILQKDSARQLLAGETLGKLRQRILRPDEHQNLALDLRNRQAACASCGIALAEEEMVSMWRSMDGRLSPRCANCATPTKLACRDGGCENKVAMSPKVIEMITSQRHACKTKGKTKEKVKEVEAGPPEELWGDEGGVGGPPPMFGEDNILRFAQQELPANTRPAQINWATIGAGTAGVAADNTVQQNLRRAVAEQVEQINQNRRRAAANRWTNPDRENPDGPF
jgi:hypothetical protein